MVLVVLIHHTIHIAETEAELVEEADSLSIVWLKLVCLLQPRNSLGENKVNLVVLLVVLLVAKACVSIECLSQDVSLLDDELTI